MISGFRREVDENCSLLGYYAARSGNLLLAFRNYISVPSSMVKTPKESLLPQYGIYIRKSVDGEKSRYSVVPANRFEAAV